MSSGFSRGDRIPDIERLDQAGKPRMLYDLQKGQPILLMIFDDPEATDTRTVLSMLARDDPDWAQITRVALIQSTPAQCRNLMDAASNNLTVLMDDGAVVTYLLGPESVAPRPIAAFAMDANFRVIERIEYGTDESLDAFMRQLKAVYKNTAPPNSKILEQQAPVLFIPRVLEISKCDELIEFFNKEGGQPSGIAHIEDNKIRWQPDPSVKMRRDVYMKDGRLLDSVKELLARRALPEIKRCFNFQVTQHEVFKLVCYDAQTGGYFRPHRDNESRDTQHRRFAMTLNLNTGDYAGGQLRFPEFGTDLYQPERGGALIFSCALLHEVIPVTTGERYVLLGFFFGDADKMQVMQY
ncbi:MAG TPA: 2OG-Fe(II) oxygenase [Gammaproteobacteria bacterium]|nr:2OG-Fe(II) oxygenase [Gammaproteobacteria bacterium]